MDSTEIPIYFIHFIYFSIQYYLRQKIAVVIDSRRADLPVINMVYELIMPCLKKEIFGNVPSSFFETVSFA